MDQDLFQFALDPVAALDALVYDVLRGKLNPGWPLPDPARQVLYLLRDHRGPRFAKPLADISAKLSMSAREVKANVKSLRDDFGIPIGANRQEPYGYYLCVTAEDRELAIRAWINEIFSLMRSVRAVGNKHQVQELLGQLHTELEKERTA